jgi:alpha-L-rhamnosidase
MNFVDVPTDCPQRDERLGWTGDAQVYVETATYFSDVHAFFKKWLETLDDSQRPDGQYPKVAPVIAGQDDGGPAWSDAGVICPTTIYQMTGDKTLLAKHYPNMKRFIEFTRSRNEDSVLPPKSFHAFGDWLSIRANTPSELIYAAYHCYSTQLVRDAAKVLGKKADYTNYDQLYRRLRGDFQREFVSQDGRIKGDTQTGYVMAIAFDLLTPSQKQLAAAHLVRDIENRGGKLSTGFVGTRDLLHALCKVGRQDVAFRLLHNEEFPSWLFPVRHGATSIWERWDGWTPENGFQDPGMNSFAHYAYGAVVGWMFKEMAGIQPLEAGFRRIRIAPRVDPKLTWQKCAYDSVRGRIRSEWRRSGKAIRFTFEVPPNTRAVIELPGKPPREVGSGVWTFS